MKKYNQLLYICVTTFFVSCSNSTEQSKRELAERCARSEWSYDNFMTLYKDLQVDGQPAGRQHYDNMIQVMAEELSDSLSTEELRKTISFNDSPLGKKLIRLGMKSKSWQAIGTNQMRWTCTEHSQIRASEKGSCPMCQRPLIETLVNEAMDHKKASNQL